MKRPSKVLSRHLAGRPAPKLVALSGWVCARVTVMLLLVFPAACRTEARAAQEHIARQDAADAYEWFSLPVSLEGLPARAEFVPVSVTINFSEALEQLEGRGAVDERSLRLYRISPNEEQREEPLQFLPNPQPRSGERKLLPGTSPSVSYLGEHPAGQRPAGIQVAGQLTWMAKADESGRGQYRLDFGIPRNGRAIQVPFPPQNLRMFDDQGRAAPVRWFSDMQIRPQWPLEGRLHILDQHQLVTSYHIGPVPETANGQPPIRRPFLYPVIGPDAVSLTDFGKPHDPTGTHAHHYSLWIAHANVAGKDFWSEKGGLIAHGQLEGLEDGPLFCRISQKTRWMNGTNALLLERREWAFYKSAGDFRLLDVALQFTPAHLEPVTFAKTSFGFLAARVAQSMTVFDGGGEILNANGDRNEQGAHLKRAAWIDQSGPIAAGKWNGLAIFDHPNNPEHPTGWHCRNDGWAGAAFNMERPYLLEPGKTLSLQYRICLHRHDAIRGEVAQRYAEYAAKPVVRVGKPITRAASR